VPEPCDITVTAAFHWRPTLRPVPIAAAGVCVLAAAAAAIWLRPPFPSQTAPGTPVVAAIRPPPAPVPQTKIPEAPTPPSFDIVRIAPDGRTVIAGRAAPNAQVSVEDQGKVIGQVQADAQGSWVFLPTTPLPPGPRELTLSEQMPGGAKVAGRASALLVVPGSSVSPAPAMAVLATPNAPPRVLQAPGRTPGKLALDAIEYGPSNEVHLGGTAPPGATVRVYVDNAPIGEARAGPDGTWSLAQATVTPGMHHLRLDQLNRAGHVTARVELPFSRDTSLAEGNVVVQPGNSLWRLARQAYGSGMRYMLIYQANHESIRDPSHIYPGQIFTIPKQPP